MPYIVKCATCGVPRQYEELRKALAAETSNCKSCAAKGRVMNPSPKMRAALIAQGQALGAKRRGVPLSEEHREKCAAKQRLNPANKGTVWNAEQRRSLSEKMKGRPVSAETRARHKASMHKHYGTEPSPSRITRVEYSIWAHAVLKRDRATCVLCGFVKTGKKSVNAHHILSQSKHPELILLVNNGVTLCVPCHAEEHRINGVL